MGQKKDEVVAVYAGSEFPHFTFKLGRSPVRQLPAARFRPVFHLGRSSTFFRGHSKAARAPPSHRYTTLYLRTMYTVYYMLLLGPLKTSLTQFLQSLEPRSKKRGRYVVLTSDTTAYYTWTFDPSVKFLI